MPLADRAGAGDSVTAVLALGLSSGADLKSAAALANKAAATVVSKPGIAYLNPEELLNVFHPQISSLLRESVTVKQRLITEQLPEIEKVVKAIIQTYRDHKTVYAFGNGGSAADANHFITELVGRFRIERKGLPAFSFSTNEILMTSIANDYGYESTFTRQVDTFVKPGDLVAAFLDQRKIGERRPGPPVGQGKGSHHGRLYRILRRELPGTLRSLHSGALGQHPPYPGIPPGCRPYHL